MRNGQKVNALATLFFNDLFNKFETNVLLQWTIWLTSIFVFNICPTYVTYGAVGFVCDRNEIYAN